MCLSLTSFSVVFEKTKTSKNTIVVQITTINVGFLLYDIELQEKVSKILKLKEEH